MSKKSVASPGYEVLEYDGVTFKYDTLPGLTLGGGLATASQEPTEQPHQFLTSALSGYAKPAKVRWLSLSTASRWLTCQARLLQ